MVSDKTYKKASGLASRAMCTGAQRNVLLGKGYDPISGPGKTQPLDSQLFDNVGVARFQERNVMGQARTRGFEGCDLALQRTCTLDQPQSSLVAAPAAGGVIGEVADGQQAAKRDQCLPPSALAPIIHAGLRETLCGIAPDPGTLTDIG